MCPLSYHFLLEWLSRIRKFRVNVLVHILIKKMMSAGQRSSSFFLSYPGKGTSVVRDYSPNAVKAASIKAFT